MTINESSDGVWRRDEVTRCRFFLRFCYRFFNRLRLARMHCERLRSAMGASSEVSLMSTGKMPVGPTARMLCYDLARVVRLHAVFAQFFAQHSQMLAVSCFYRAKDMHRRNIRAGEG